VEHSYKLNITVLDDVHPVRQKNDLSDATEPMLHATMVRGLWRKQWWPHRRACATLKLTRGQRNAEFVAKGEADIAVQLSNEIRTPNGSFSWHLPALRRLCLCGTGTEFHFLIRGSRIVAPLVGDIGQ
jgi:hypothetical protein